MEIGNFILYNWDNHKLEESYMHKFNYNISLTVLLSGALVSSTTYAAESEKNITPSDTMEIVSTEVATAEDNNEDIEVVSPEISVTEPVTADEPDNGTVTEQETSELPETAEPETAEPETEVVTTPEVQPESEIPPTQPVPSVPTELPVTERPTTEEPQTEEPSTEPPVSNEAVEHPAAPTTEIPTVEPPAAHIPEPTPARETDNKHQIKPGKFSPHAGEQYYRSLDEKVSQLVTQKVDKIDEKKSKVKDKDSKKDSKKDKKQDSKQKKMTALPDTGENAGIALLGFALLSIGLLFLRRTTAEK